MNEVDGGGMSDWYAALLYRRRRRGRCCAWCRAGWLLIMGATALQCGAGVANVDVLLALCAVGGWTGIGIGARE